MTISHHPGEELLLSYASGAANEAAALLVASHLALCSDCRMSVAAAEAAGGSVLSQVAPVALDRNAYDAVLARLDAPTAEIVRGANLAGNVPAPLQPYVGSDFDNIPWRHIVHGLSYYPLLTRDGTRARLIRAKAGAGVAEHTHRGEEWTLVLAGSYRDVTGRYAVGDVQTTTPQIRHEPTADPGPVCINLAVTDAPLVFAGLLPKIVGKIFGF
ncbi:MAG TPA: ChrR family anti-sigma-E factor [Rhizomicrobium sp.]|jgi:putative transcriptional regulator|nr:ChrR family anti-sigma-E factor [Rhizomicrobium sp.]